MNPNSVSIDVGGVWHYGLFTLTALCALKLTWRYPIWSYLVIWALYLVEFPGNQFGEYHAAFQASAGQTLCEALLIPLFVLSLSDKWVSHSITLMRILVLSAAWCVWTGRDGFLVAPSFNTAFLALYLPFADLPTLIISLVTIAFHHGATAQLMVVGYLFVLALHTRQRRAAIGLLAIIPLVVTAAYFHSNTSWFDSSDRIQHWLRYFAFWKTEWKYIAFGTGPGTFMHLGMMIDEYKQPFFLSMHSDWLQVLFELGAVGLALTLWLVLAAIREARGNARLVCAVVGCCAMAGTYHGLRFAPTALLMALIFRKALGLRLFGSDHAQTVLD